MEFKGPGGTDATNDPRSLLLVCFLLAVRLVRGRSSPLPSFSKARCFTYSLIILSLCPLLLRAAALLLETSAFHSSKASEGPSV